MLVMSQANLVFLSNPKTGSTALEMALRRHADMAFVKRRKHMPANRYRRKVAPFLRDTFDLEPKTVAVMREPTEQIRSWYRYRMREERDGHKASTAGMRFDDFVRAVISDAPPAYAGIGSQFRFLTDPAGDVAVDHLFAYERMEQLLDFLSKALKAEIKPERRNVSPPVEAALSPDVEAKLREVRAPDFALYDRLLAADGHLSAD